MSGRRDAAQQALAGIPGFERATAGERLAAGPVSDSWRVQRSGEDFVLRVDRPQAAELGLDRANERAVAAAVADAGLTVPYLCFDAVAGVALRPFAPGRPWAPADLADPGRLSALAAALRALHALPPVGRRFDPAGAARRYAGQIGTAQALQLARQAQAAWEAIPAGDRGPVLCHNDLVAENILQLAGGGVLLIDWEYAGLGDGLFDLAVVVQHHGLESGLAAHFLHVYLERPPTDAERHRFEGFCGFYAMLLRLWNQRTGSDL